MKLKHFHPSPEQPDDRKFAYISRRDLNRCVNEWIHWYMTEFVVVAEGEFASYKEYNATTRNEASRLKWLGFMGRSFSAKERKQEIDYSLADELALQCRGLAWAIRKAAAGSSVYVYPDPPEYDGDACYFAVRK